MSKPEHSPLPTSAELRHEMRELVKSQRAAIAELVEALMEYRHAVSSDTGFVTCVRADSGKAYPWPALDIADIKAQALIAKHKAVKP